MASVDSISASAAIQPSIELTGDEPQAAGNPADVSAIDVYASEASDQFTVLFVRQTFTMISQEAQRLKQKTEELLASLREDGE